MFNKKSIKKIYTLSALFCFHTLVVFLLFNILLSLLLWGKDSFSGSVDSRVSAYREKFSDIKAYHNISEKVASEYLDEQDKMESVGFQYKPWTQFRNPEVRGKWLNTDASGFRNIPGDLGDAKKKRKKSLKIFVLGGSTTFGYGVPDEWTIPSHMQRILAEKNVEVQNYGQGFYYSSQEMVLLWELIKAGKVPDIVVFIDGTNDCLQLHLQEDRPFFTPEIEKAWQDQAQGHSFAWQEYSWIPMVRLALGLQYRLFPPAVPKKEKSSLESSRYIANSYKSNKRMIEAICQEYGIQPYFVWQPTPFYKYKRELHRTFPYEGKVPKYWEEIYREMENYEGKNFLYLGSILEYVKEKVFTDDVHYNGKYNNIIAEHICQFLNLKK